MTNPAPETQPLTAGDLRVGGGIVAFVALLGALVWFTIFPRFEIHVINDGQSILIHDRWRNRIQRADYDANGDPTLKRMLTPF